MEKIGIDVHKVATQVCILTEDGEFEEHGIRTEREALTALFGERARARVVLEAATESEWVARHLESLGHEVVVADPKFASMYASRSRKVKSDRRDARALCEACHLRAYRPAHRSSDGSRMRRKSAAVREVVVQTRSRMISLCRALQRQEGIGVPRGGAASFAKRVRTLELSEELAQAVKPLLETHERVCEQIDALDAPAPLNAVVAEGQAAADFTRRPAVLPRDVLGTRSGTENTPRRSGRSPRVRATCRGSAAVDQTRASPPPSRAGSR